jgi:UDPglucose--hexose-1-phosphate uridylyltransferase
MASVDLRQDALSGHTVIVARGRDARPRQFRSADAGADPGTAQCPFCPGHESMTPPEVMRTGGGEPDGPGWRVRVTPNLYPIVDAHEVVVLSPDHDRSFGGLDDRQAAEVLGVLRDRVAAHLASGHRAAFAIVNHKREAGASLPHPHGQVLATDFVPPGVAAAVERVERADADLVLADASRDGSLVLEKAPVLAWCPYASVSPYEVRVAHPLAGARFDQASDDEVDVVAVMLRDVLASLGRTLDDPPYNLVLHSAPPGAPRFHWYAEIVPRIAVVAGFELATGLFVNSVGPDRAAEMLRAAMS